MIQKVLVLGGGSAGLIAAMTLKRAVPQFDVRVIRSPEIGIIGVGEGTTPSVVTHLHSYLKLPHREFHLRAKPTWKLGLRLIWGPRGDFHFSFSPNLTLFQPGLVRNNAFYCETDFVDANPLSALMKRNKAFPQGRNGKPEITFDSIAYHIENVQFVEFLEWQCLQDGVKITEGMVTQVGREGDRVTHLNLEDGERVEADLFVDASGFRAKLIGETLEEPFDSFGDTLFCDRAVAGPRDRKPGEVIRPYTIAETMDHGWCWQIDHEHHVNRGYVYSSAFVSDEDAEAEFRRINPDVRETRIVKFRSGCRTRTWVGNVVAIGNAAGFVEPLEATAIGMICTQARNLVTCLKECRFEPTPSVMGIYNRFIDKEWHDIRDFLAVHYRFNTMKDTPFWRHCREATPLHSAEALIEFFRENGPSPLANHTLITGLHQFGLEGYYSMLIGMKVPHDKHYTPGPEEKSRWDLAQAEWVRRARNGVGVAEALEIIRDPNVKWAS